MDFSGHWAGLCALGIFCVAYVLVILEEITGMAKSKPVLLAAGLIWALIGVAFSAMGQSALAHDAALGVIEEYGELFLFLIVAVTYVNTLEERRAFDALRGVLVRAGLSYRQLFALTGVLAFFLSGVLDNLTTALVMGAVVMALGRDSPKFAVVACVSVVVAANAGGAFSPFGDITTLMVWQQGKLDFFEFFALFVPSAVNCVVPALIMIWAVPKGRPVQGQDRVRPKPGRWGVVALFAATIATSVAFKNALNLPPALGMMLGLGYLQALAYGLRLTGARRGDGDMVLDSFAQVQRVEWDTLFFFFWHHLCGGWFGGAGVFGAGLAGSLCGLGAVGGQYHHRRFVRSCGQYPPYVRRLDDGSGDEPRPLAADHADVRGGRFDLVDRIGGGGGFDGAGAGGLHLWRASALGLGGGLGLWGRDCDASVVECGTVLRRGASPPHPPEYLRQDELRAVSPFSGRHPACGWKSPIRCHTSQRPAPSRIW